MKPGIMLILVAIVVSGCGGRETATEVDRRAEGVSSPKVASDAAPAAVADSGGGPCAALDAAPVRYDAAGKPVAYTFEYPGGWQVDELFSAGVTSLDVTKSVDEHPAPEFVLRFGHVVGKPLENPGGLVETWRKLPMIEEVLEIDVEGRTMYVAKSRIGEMIGFQALFPDVTSDEKAWMVSGGVTSAPKGCREEAIAAVERIIRSFEPNPDIGPPPAE